MILPVGADTIAEAVRMGSEVFHTLRKELAAQGHNTNVGDEGGFAPGLKSAPEALDFIMKSVEKAGYKPGEDIYLGLDCASTEFFKDGKYVLEGKAAPSDRAPWPNIWPSSPPSIRSSRSRTAWPKTIGTAGRR